jgi:hypothetical protein
MSVLKNIFVVLPQWWTLLPDQAVLSGGGNSQGDMLNLGAETLIMFDDRNLRMSRDEPDQFFPSSGDDQVNLILQVEHLLDGFSFNMRKNLDCLLEVCIFKMVGMPVEGDDAIDQVRMQRGEGQGTGGSHRRA